MSWSEAGTRNGGFEFAGVQIQQHPDTLLVLPEIIMTTFPQGSVRVVEFGTAAGGLAVYMRQILPRRIELMTYGIHTVCPQIAMLITNLGINFRVQDIFCERGPEMVKADLAFDGGLVLICDNGNKVAEVNTYAQYLKSGDVLMCHDYRVNKDVDGLWPWCEITYPQIQQTIQENGFVEHMQEVAARAGYGCFRKRE